VIRAATSGDGAAIAAVAAEYGFDEPDSGIDPRYLALLEQHGRLAVAEVDGRIVGFGGAIESCGAMMLTDLFVLEQFHARGIGGGLVQRLVGDCRLRMTFSSSHPRAVPTYQRFGMEPRWALRYLRGRIVHVRSMTAAVDVGLSDWAGPRRELAAHWAGRNGRLLHIGGATQPTGTAIVTASDRGWTLQRMFAEGAHAVAMAAVLAVLPPGDELVAFVPAWSAAAAMLDSMGFDETDRDTFCASAEVLIPPTAVVLHPGLA
jgi:GNAT superfamily N-acetyltransferase